MATMIPEVAEQVLRIEATAAARARACVVVL
jgi:hypothetical protein